MTSEARLFDSASMGPTRNRMGERVFTQLRVACCRKDDLSIPLSS
jgi:hypothetical protein